jgi:hemolysin activation/secretion protein
MSHMNTRSWPFRRLPAACAIGSALAFFLGSGNALAQQAMPQATGATTQFPINAFELTGDVPLSAEESARVLAPFIGPDGTLLTLQKATAALEAELKTRGFALLRVSLPPQEVGATVRLHVVKFAIGKVTVEGLSRYGEANIRASVPELREGETPNFKLLAIQTAIANESQGKQVQVSLRESEAADKIDARLLVTEARAWNFSASLSNSGSESTGRDRLALLGGHSNVFDLDHQFSVAYTTSLERIKDVKQLGLNYRIPLYRQGAVIGLAYTSSDVVGNFGSFNSTGAGQTLGFNYSHYFEPEGGLRSYVMLGLDQKRFNASLVNGVAVPGQQERGSRPLTVGYWARTESDRAAWGYNVELAANLPGGSGNDLAAYQSEDVRISDENWRALRGAVNYAAAFGSGWMWSVRGQLQYSAQALISGEQFGLGGVASVRGAGERAISGDSGLLATLEITGPEFMPGWRALGFIDAGILRNNNPDVNPNKPVRDHLAGVGFGLRYGAGTYRVTADWGRLLLGSVLPTTSGSSLPQSGDQKIHVNLTASF